MAKKIYIETERFEGMTEAESFNTLTLTGETFDAKEIIKSIGKFQFSNPVGHEKAWRTMLTFKNSELAVDGKITAKGEELKKIITETVAALKSAGYEVFKK